ncbi:MAG TPA: hypothetical protein V6D26_04065, partial [Stenomitos sp.]
MRDRLIPRHWVSLKRWFRARGRRLLSTSLLILGILLGSWLLINTVRLQAVASEPVDVFFVLGGGIEREIHVAQLAKQQPEVRVLISQGSE